MNMLARVASISQARKVEDMTLEQIMEELLNYGQPKLGVYGSDCKWSCSVDMNTNTVGADFKVRSEWDHITPLRAAKECLERAISAVNQYRG